MRRISIPITPERELSRMQSLCSRSEISSGEALTKMLRRGLNVAEAKQIVEKLEAMRFIDDRRFAGAFTREKACICRWSKRKIVNALMVKGVARDIISEAVAEIDPQTFAESLAHALSVKIKYHPELADTREGRLKLYAYGVRSGFPSSDVAAALRKIAQDRKNG